MSTPLKIFLSYASDDGETVESLYEKLNADKRFDPWWFKVDSDLGEWRPSILGEIASRDVFIVCLSPESIKKFEHRTGFLVRELQAAVEASRKNPFGLPKISPVILKDCDTTGSIPITKTEEFRLSDYNLVDLTSFDSGWEELQKKLLCERENRDLKKLNLNLPEWERLETYAREIVAHAGFAAMGYYRSALADSSPIDGPDGIVANPSTEADMAATLAALQFLPAGKMIPKHDYCVFAEELAKQEIREKILQRLRGNLVYDRVLASAEELRSRWADSIAILLDAIDGTMNFDAALPFFCSAAAIFIKGQLSIGAIYDPIHHQVYYGSLRATPDERPRPVAFAWDISSGTRENLQTEIRSRPSHRILATHVSRSDSDKRARMLALLSRICGAEVIKGGTCMLNSGQLALAHVAAGHAAAFVNNTTGIWDVAAGEVIIKAVGGKVTDFKGNEIDYGTQDRIEVVAARDPVVHEQLLALIGKHYET